MQGRILQGNGKTYKVFSEGKLFDLSPKGILKISNTKLAVGDYVEFSPTSLTIDKILPRHSFLYRPRIANIDQILILHSLVEPDFDLGLVLKYLTYMNMNDIKASVVITKTGKCNNQEKINQILNIFDKIGIKIYFIDSKTKDGLESLLNDLKYQTIALVGQSGVGKSSLINAIDDNYNREIGDYSFARGRGKHQTTEIILLPFNDGFLADTPGFSDIELNLTKLDAARFYPGCYKNYHHCFYSNCMHMSENKCHIKELVNVGDLPIEIYNEYVKYLNSLPISNRR